MREALLPPAGTGLVYQDVLHDMVHSNLNLLITGRAGCGKTELIRSFLANYPGRVLVTAPTGCAAEAIPGAVTNHAAFGLRPSVALKWEPAELGYHQIMAIVNCDTWLLDEASMVRKDVFEHINATLQSIRGNRLPFGGVRFIGVGDFWQLPPVTPGFDEEYVIAGTDGHRFDEYFFLSSRAFCNREVFSRLRMYELGGSFRQKSDELLFLQLLDRVRYGFISEMDLCLLNSRLRFENETQIPILTSTRASRDLYNQYALSSLHGRHYTADPTIEWAPGETIIPDILFDQPGTKRLDLVEGMRVVFNKNDPGQHRWVNGSCGTIREILRSDRDTVSGLLVDLDKGTGPVLVTREGFDVYMPGLDLKNDRACTRKAVTVNNFPVEPGYAITIHKSQGKSMDSAFIDLGRQAFAPGQFYVALSRIRSFQGLFLARPIKLEDVIVSKYLSSYYLRTIKARIFAMPS